MSNIVREELWKHPGFPGMIVVTTNATIKSNNGLVMGRGAAREARDRISCIDQECGLAIKAAINRSYQLRDKPAPDQYVSVGYYFLEVRPPTEDKVGFGIFQVKVHYAEAAEVELIRRSAARLADYARQHPDTAIRMNYPGIGHGHLSRSEVEPLLADLPDNITICWR